MIKIFINEFNATCNNPATHILLHLIHIDNRAGKTMESSQQSKVQIIFRRRRDDGTHGISSANTNKLRFRNSLSEGDLLHEIDNALVFSKGFLFGNGRKQIM